MAKHRSHVNQEQRGGGVGGAARQSGTNKAEVWRASQTLLFNKCSMSLPTGFVTDAITMAG